MTVDRREVAGREERMGKGRRGGGLTVSFHLIVIYGRPDFNLINIAFS